VRISSLFGVLLSSIGLRVVSASFLFGIGVILAKWLGPEKFGFYTLIFSVASIIGIPITAGMPSLLTRETANLVAANHVSRLKGLLVFPLD
jgi:O-antigen/teichoic acid export membrane protein